MLALRYVYQLLHSFRSLFARHATWVTFCLIILGLLGTHHLEGVSAVCRFWQLGEPDYHRLLHFFHSSAWSLNGLVTHWSQLVLSHQVAVPVAGRVVLVGDHTYVVKEARRMPGGGDALSRQPNAE